MKRDWWPFIAALAVATATFALHRPCLHGEFLDWDDDIYLEEATQHSRSARAAVRWAFTTVTPFYYHPLTRLSHALDYRLWGTNPVGHHLTSLALHAANAGILVLFLWRLLEFVKVSRGERFALAGGVALVFGIHPLQVESVAWVAERKNVLCGFFSLACLWAYLNAVTAQAGTAGRRRFWFAATALLFAALLSKPMAVSLPAVMLAMDFYPLQRHRAAGWARLVREKWLMFTGCIALTVLTFVGQIQWGAVRGLDTLGVPDRALAALRGDVFYLWKLIRPAWLSPYYPLGEVSLKQPEFLVPALVVAAITGLCVVLARRAPVLPAAWAAHWAWIIPVSGLFQAGAQAAGDRFMYLAMLPVALVAGAGIVWLWRRTPVAVGVALLSLVAAQLVYFAWRTRQQIPVWRSVETLWRDVTSRFPRSGVANLHWATFLCREGRFADAVPHALQSVTIGPGNPVARAVLGLAYLKTDRVDEALEELELAVSIEPTLPAANYNLACVYTRLGRFDDALEALERLLKERPIYASLLMRDREFEALRTNSEYGVQFRTLTEGAIN
jgi:tetratricopeptide (TPR) repeat protein